MKRKSDNKYNIYQKTKKIKSIDELPNILITNIDNYPMIKHNDYKIRLLDNGTNMKYIESFISNDEIKHLMELAKGKFKKTSPNQIDCTSYRVNFGYNQYPIIKNIEERIAKICESDIQKLQSLELFRYKNGQFIGPHYDYFRIVNNYSEEGGQRITTIVIYLNKLHEYEYKNGGTVFPELGMKIVPKKKEMHLYGIMLI